VYLAGCHKVGPDGHAHTGHLAVEEKQQKMRPIKIDIALSDGMSHDV
jgi:hypothetical protein